MTLPGFACPSVHHLEKDQLKNKSLKRSWTFRHRRLPSSATVIPLVHKGYSQEVDHKRKQNQITNHGVWQVFGGCSFPGFHLVSHHLSVGESRPGENSKQVQQFITSDCRFA